MKPHRKKLSPHERRLFEKVDFGRMEARLHAVAAIRLLAELAKDPGVDVETRRGCALSILDRAYGKPGVPREWQRVEVAIMTAPVDDVEGRIADAVAVANQMAERDRYLSKVHPSEWPAWLVQEMGEAGARAYAELMA